MIIIRNSSILEKYTIFPDNAILSDDVTSNTFRNGRELIVKDGRTAAVSNGTWSISGLDTNNYISFSIDLANTELPNGDTIEGAYSVPEPAIPELSASDPNQ